MCHILINCCIDCRSEVTRMIVTCAKRQDGNPDKVDEYYKYCISVVKYHDVCAIAMIEVASFMTTKTVHSMILSHKCTRDVKSIYEEYVDMMEDDRAFEEATEAVYEKYADERDRKRRARMESEEGEDAFVDEDEHDDKTHRELGQQRCPKCKLSRDPNRPDLVHVRLGLDEAPQPLICKCKPANEVIAATARKYSNVNPVVVTKMSAIPPVELEIRMCGDAFETVFAALRSGMMGTPMEDEISEVGCSWWTGMPSNYIAKMRTRTNEGNVAKIVMSTCEIMPGFVVGISYEYLFAGTVTRREGDREEAIGSMNTFRNYVNKDFISEMRSADHDVLDVTNLDTHRGPTTMKVDGVKTYVFCYPSGYVITFTDDNLSIYD
ncbi:hypothetical protein diail_12011 [Diaporthe ilicicola]|nr:hypothetical protein diail_12011 [Diaporthe ilicicola]